MSEMRTLKMLLLSMLVLFAVSARTQTVYDNGSVLHLSSGGVLYSNGGFQLSSNSQLTNNGTLTVTKNSSAAQAGNFIIGITALSLGDGEYFIEQDWINDGTFTAGNSAVEFYGNTEQLITSNNATVTTFNDLILSGNGSGTNRRKSLRNVDAKVGSLGTLNINDRELFTEVNSFFVLNPDDQSVLNSTVFGGEGFVSSILPGYFIRETNLENPYLFPVGSSEGVLRYRPIVMSPSNSTTNAYGVRLNNHLADVDGYVLSQKESSISGANNLFYHSIDRLVGNATADIAIHYLSSEDGNFEGIANWSSSESQWKSLTSSISTLAVNYDGLTKSGYDFSLEDPFVLINNSNFIIPTAFTPNGNSVNEFWELPSIDEAYPKNVVRIYNRWGNMLYEHDSAVDGPYVDDPWDGTYNNEPLPVGSYFYIIDLDPEKKEFASGTVTLIKK